MTAGRPATAFPLRPNERAVLARLLRTYVRPHRAKMAAAMSCMVLVALTTAANAWLIQPVLDRVFLARDATMLVVIPLAVVAIGALKGLAGFGEVVLMSRVGQGVIARVQADLHAHLMRADVGVFTAGGSGALISRLTYDVGLLREALSSVLAGMVRDGLTVLALAGLMAYQDWRLALLAFLTVPPAVYWVLRAGRRTRKVSTRGQSAMGLLTGRLEETFRGIRQVKAYGQEDHEAARTALLIDEQRRLQIKAARAKEIVSPVVETLAAIAIAGVIYYGGARVLDGDTTPGAFFSFVAALLMAYQPGKSLGKMSAKLQEGLAAADRVYEVLDARPVIRDAPDARPLRVDGGRIAFEGVRFAYAADRPALDGVDLVVPAGATLALVGPSGGGKSSLVNLLLRFHDPDSGRVTVDGRDVRGVTLKSLRAAIALVSQEVGLFDDTVRANIAYGRPDASEEAVVAAAKAAAAHEFIAQLADGYATRVGPAGALLSGGQRQRLTIARAVLKDAPILVLDEATSALDAESERAVQGALHRLSAGRTTLVIAHRLSTIMSADRIAVVEAGRIAEEGTHADLLATSGRYAELFRLQALRGAA